MTNLETCRPDSSNKFKVIEKLSIDNIIDFAAISLRAQIWRCEISKRILNKLFLRNLILWMSSEQKSKEQILDDEIMPNLVSWMCLTLPKTRALVTVELVYRSFQIKLSEFDSPNISLYDLLETQYLTSIIFIFLFHQG